MILPFRVVLFFLTVCHFVTPISSCNNSYECASGEYCDKNETCAELQRECENHEDCGVGTGRWCDKNYHCHDCNNGECLDTYNFFLGGSSNYTESIDGVCPASCCDWVRGYLDGDGYEDDDVTIFVSVCDTDVEVDAYFSEGLEPDITATKLKNEGTRCEVERKKVLTSSVTKLDCNLRGDLDACEEIDGTVGLVLVKNRNDALLETVEFMQTKSNYSDPFDESNPVARTFEREATDTMLPCTSSEDIEKVVFGLLFIVIALCVLACCCITGILVACGYFSCRLCKSN